MPKKKSELRPVISAEHPGMRRLPSPKIPNHLKQPKPEASDNWMKMVRLLGRQ